MKRFAIGIISLALATSAIGVGTAAATPPPTSTTVIRPLVTVVGVPDTESPVGNELRLAPACRPVPLIVSVRVADCANAAGRLEIDKEAMLKDPEKARLIIGVSIGREGENFYVEPVEFEIQGSGQ